MTRKEYNGWTNYETWAVALWMDNEEGSQRYWQDRAEELVKDCDDDKDEAAHKLADEIQSQHEEVMPQCAGVFGDLIGAAMSEVNWGEIAFHYTNEVEVETEETEEAEA